MVLAAIGCGFGARFLDPRQALCTKPLGGWFPSPTVVATKGTSQVRFVVVFGADLAFQLEIMSSLISRHAKLC